MKINMFLCLLQNKIGEFKVILLLELGGVESLLKVFPDNGGSAFAPLTKFILCYLKALRSVKFFVAEISTSSI
jgi:hypothetical protein